MPWPSPNNRETVWVTGSLSAGANLLSSEFDQDTTRYLYARFWFEWDCPASGTAGDYVEMYLLSKEPGGTNYPNGDASVDPKDGLVFVWKTDWENLDTNYLSADHLLLPNSDFKVLIKSEAAQLMNATVYMQRYNEPTS